MDEFVKLLEIADRLLSDQGCPWDREQTLFTLQPYLLEETHELIEAIDSQDPKEMVEELGDVLYSLVFIGKLGEKEKLFSIREAIHEVSEKLIRRHPHVFGETTLSSSEEVIENWEKTKRGEMKSKGRKTILDGIPPTLPSLARAQKIVQKLKRAKSELIRESKEKFSEEEIVEKLWQLIADADASSIDLESALRRFSGKIEKTVKQNTGE